MHPIIEVTSRGPRHPKGQTVDPTVEEAAPQRPHRPKKSLKGRELAVTIGGRITTLRTQRSTTVEALAGKLHVPKSTLERWLSGATTMNAADLVKVAEHFSCSLHWLLTGRHYGVPTISWTEDDFEANLAARLAGALAEEQSIGNLPGPVPDEIVGTSRVRSARFAVNGRAALKASIAATIQHAREVAADARRVFTSVLVASEAQYLISVIEQAAPQSELDLARANALLGHLAQSENDWLNSSLSPTSYVSISIDNDDD